MNNVLKIFLPRLTYIGIFTILIIGSATMADWQTIGNDPCRIFSIYHHAQSEFNTSEVCQQYRSQTFSNHCVGVYSTVKADPDNITSLASELCTTTHGCHWNQYSVIDNTSCISCPAMCRSEHHSLSFIQFTIGAMLFTCVIPIGDVCAMLLITSLLLPHEQVTLKCIWLM